MDAAYFESLKFYSAGPTLAGRGEHSSDHSPTLDVTMQVFSELLTREIIFRTQAIVELSCCKTEAPHRSTHFALATEEIGKVLAFGGPGRSIITVLPSMMSSSCRSHVLQKASTSVSNS